jgi:hypothetical protein
MRFKVPDRKGKFAIRNFLLDSRYTNLPEDGIHRNCVWIAAFGRIADIHRRGARPGRMTPPRG